MGVSYAVVIILDGVIFLSASAKIENEIGFELQARHRTQG